MGMKVYKRKTLTIMLIISAVLMLAYLIALMVMSGGLSAFGSDLGFALIMLIGGIPAGTLGTMATILNFKKSLIGFIAPIPVLSFFIEFVKGIIYSVKAIIVIIKKKDRLVICDGKAVIDGVVEYEEEEAEDA